MFSAKTFVERHHPSVRNRMLGYFFNRLMHDLDYGLPDGPDHNRGLDPAKSPVNTSRLPITNQANFLEAHFWMTSCLSAIRELPRAGPESKCAEGQARLHSRRNRL